MIRAAHATIGGQAHEVRDRETRSLACETRTLPGLIEQCAQL